MNSLHPFALAILLLVLAVSVTAEPHPISQANGEVVNTAFRAHRRFPSTVLQRTCLLRGGSDEVVTSANMASEEQSPIKFFIFIGGLCPFAGRTWIVLQELGLPFEMVFVDYRKEERPQWFLDVNPRGRVPALYNPKDGVSVYESSICNEYLCDLDAAAAQQQQSMTNSIMPSRASERAKLRLLNDMFDKDVFPKVRGYLMNEEDTKEQEMKALCEQGLEILRDSLAASNGGPYFMGSDFTVADAHVVPFFMRWLVQLRAVKGFDIAKDGRYSKLVDWYEHCRLRKSVQVATIADDKIMEVHWKKVQFLKQQQQQRQQSAVAGSK